jgi:molecular chaperone GrpE
MSNPQNFSPLAEGADESGAPLDLSPADADPLDPVATLEAARNEATQARDQLLRAMADAENMRRRTQTDIANAHRFAIENFATNLLPVKDTLEMALADKASSVDQIKMGVDLTLKNLAAAFDKAKIVEVTPQGQKFDPNRHQAMSEVESDQPAGTVVQVFQKGYMIAERVLRPALVAVAKAKSSTA